MKPIAHQFTYSVAYVCAMVLLASFDLAQASMTGTSPRNVMVAEASGAQASAKTNQDKAPGTGAKASLADRVEARIKELHTTQNHQGPGRLME